MIKKKVYLEIIRLIAIFFVLYEHTGERAKWIFNVTDNMGSYYLSLGMTCLSQMCVFLFFVISGIVLLKKEETIKQVFMNRVLPLIVVILVFGLFQYYYNYMHNPQIGFDFGVYLKLIYSTDVITQYWFLRAYLGFLILLPLLRALVKNMKKEHFYYFLGIYTIVNSILPILERIWENEPLKIDFPMFESLIVFPVLGYFLEYVLKEDLLKAKSVLLVNVIGIIAFIIYVMEVHTNYSEFGQLIALKGFSLVIMVMLFTDVKILCTKFKMPAWLEKSIIFLGNGVFGVYLFEPQVRQWCCCIYDVLASRITWFFALFVWLFAAMFIGIMIMNILKKIPLIKHIF